MFEDTAPFAPQPPFSIPLYTCRQVSSFVHVVRLINYYITNAIVSLCMINSLCIQSYNQEFIKYFFRHQNAFSYIGNVHKRWGNQEIYRFSNTG